ncbi:excalibur calcium-binding domain-containing protein [uncultured Amnibacterium sp.]|uniref:excalibur calcium-binding domain-containing protein n=1 Tax=uncultured Amnibacterium sp. TaxID=1631851 RepID=UPI0035CC53F7
MRKPPLASLVVGAVMCVAAAIPTMAFAESPAPAPAKTAPVRAAAAPSVSARTLLARLDVAKEARAASFRAARFSGWVDADGDGADTRAEVLSSESTTPVTVDAKGAVRTGRWVSPYDGVTVSSVAKARVDHLVPLKEAWVSGAASWTSTKRQAFTNDLGFAPALAVISVKAARAKGSREPDAYLPSLRSDRCTYVKDWIATKYRWGLSVDPVEQRALAADLTTYCTSVSVRKPGKPSVAVLLGAGAGAGVGVGTGGAYYASCAAVRAAGKSPLLRGQPGYRGGLDRDGDGVACE